MSRATRQNVTAVVLIAALAATGTAQDGGRHGYVQRAGGHHASDQGRGLLGALFGPASGQSQPTARHSRTQPPARVQPVGLLDRLRSITDSDGGVPSAADTPQPAGPADWTGVPYHQPRGSAAARAPQPIRDPSDASPGSQSRSASRSHAARVDIQQGTGRMAVGAVPTPPSEIEAAAGNRRSTAAATKQQPASRAAFSATSSSRRSGRRTVDPLEAATASPSDLPPETRSSRTTHTPPSPQTPRVAQRALPTPHASSSDASSSPETAMGLASRRPGGGTPPSLAASAGAGAETDVAAADAPDLTVASTNTGAAAGVEAAEGSPGAGSEAADSSIASTDDGWQAGGSRAAEESRVAGDEDSAASPAAEAVGSGLAATGSAKTGGPSLRAATPDTAPATGQTPPPAAEASTATNAISSEVPGVRVINQGPANLVIHQVTEYEIRVENLGSTEAPGVFVRTVLPHWVEVRGHHASRGEVAAEQNKRERQLLWQVDRLAAGATERLSLRLAAEQSGTFDVAIDWTLLPQTNVAHVRVQEPKLQLLIEGPDQVVYGESATYKVRVLNPGDGPAPNVAFTLSPNSATPQTQQIGSIPAGKEAQFEVELAAQDMGDLQIHGLATGDQSLRTEATKSIRVAAAKLEAVLSGPQLKYQDSEARYELTVVNSGTAPSREITATLRLPAGVQYLGGLDGVQADGDMLRWQIDQLPPAASREYAFRCGMSSTGSHLLAFDCTGTAGGQAAVSIATRVEALADLVLTIADPPAPAPVGSEVAYEVTIRNRGSKAATAVQAVTHFSDGIEPVRVEGHAAEISLGQVQFAVIPRIEAGQEIRLRVVAQAAAAGLHRFRTEVTSGETVLVAEEATRYLSAATEQISRRSSDGSQR